MAEKRLRRFSPTRIRPGEAAELNSSRNFDSLVPLLNGYAEEIETRAAGLDALVSKVGKIIPPAILGAGKIYDVRAFGTLAKAITYIGSDFATLYITNEQAVTANTTIPSNISIVVLKGGSFAISTGVTLTIEGPFEAGDFVIKTGAGSLAFSYPGDTRIQWFYNGSDYGPAINQAEACRGDLGNRLINPPVQDITIATTITRNTDHVYWKGHSASSNDESAQRIVWAGAVDGTMMTANNITGGTFEKLVFDGAHRTKWCWNINEFRKVDIRGVVLQRSIGFILGGNTYYSDPDYLDCRLMTPGIFVGEPGGPTLAAWEEVCRDNFLAPITFRSNANTMRIARVTTSRLGAYELPAGASGPIRQMMLISGQNMDLTFPRFESIESSSISVGALDGGLFTGDNNFGTGIFGTTQLSNPVLGGVDATNSDDHVLYGELTDVAGTRTIELYSNSGRTTLIASGSRVGNGVTILHPQAGTTFKGGQITVTYTGDDLDWYIRWNYMTTVQFLKIDSGAAINIDQIYLEVAFLTRMATISALTRGGVNIGRIYAEDAYFSDSWISSASIKDLTIGPIVGIGVVSGGSYISDNSSSTLITYGSVEVHNRFVASGGVNYSEELSGNLGMASTPASIPIILQPQVISGLVASNPSSNLIYVTPGSIRDGLGRLRYVGRYEEVNGLTGHVGKLFRPTANGNYNVCVDAETMVYLELQSAVKQTAEQGKIVIATFTLAAGVVSAFTAISSPVCARGILTPLAGGLTVPAGILEALRGLFTAGLSLMGTATFAMGVSAQPDVGLYVSEAVTWLTGTTQYGALIRPTFGSGTNGRTLETQVRVAAGVTLPNGHALHIASPVLGAGAAITNLKAINIEDQTGGHAIKTGVGRLEFGDDVEIASGKVLKVNGTQVVTTQQTGMGATLGAATAGAAYTAAEQTMLQAVYDKMVSMETKLKTHGLIAT